MGKAIAACLWGVAAFFFCAVIAEALSVLESHAGPESNAGANVVWCVICVVAGLVCWLVL